ncbi:zinc transporter foi-like isoform X2 [Anopheles bellator]|uniref:zinc transporter foi-like isoform X2 n=1 Tax=Anopheles bellator TaxID=139047 RepID=UPI002649F2A8|nr:zinc transporter foi-like isoform X2 [Anopheles bellator]
MARHIMAVCVVCLLCADHVPCKQHFIDDGSPNGVGGKVYDRGATFPGSPKFTDQRRPLGDPSIEPAAITQQEAGHRLVKRHQHNHHDGEDDHEEDERSVERTEFEELLKPKVQQFVEKIFTEFGNPDTMTMDGKGFERMMHRLGLYQLVGGDAVTLSPSIDNPITTSTIDSERRREDASKCLNSSEFLRRVTVAMVPSQEWQKDDHSSSGDASLDSNGSNRNVTLVDSRDRRIQNISISGDINSTTSNDTGHDVLVNGLFNTSNSSQTLPMVATSSASVFDARDLYNVCPLLLTQLLSSEPLARAGCIEADSVPGLQASSHNHHHHHQHDHRDNRAVWIYSSLAILGVSLCGLLGVVVIPCMDKHFYHHALQFLVALAVGTLCGDALLHLLPHAMMSSVHSLATAHDQMMFKGLAAVLGIVFFYFMERLLTVIAEWYKNREKKDKPSSRVRVMRDPESNSLHHGSGGGEKQCKHKYSSYPYCYDEIAMDTKDDHHEHNQVNENHNSALAKCANSHGEQHTADHGSNEYGALNNHNSSSVAAQSNNHRHSANREETVNNSCSIDNNTVSTNLDDGSIESSDQQQQQTHNKVEATETHRHENYTIILREHETKHHGHSHTHGHVHSPPGSLSAVAWMVIMGDGLHNFTDGMTIGAAFANNIAGGFSTAIAVFCHELPHELGDFAVLLKAGMSAKEAVYYNLLSSLLSLFGMIVGIMVGHQPEASAWIFAVAAGMFLYIAMVDMIPELTSSHGAEERCKLSEFGLQFLGLTVGFGIMMVIAMYEHDLMEMFVH